MGSGIAALSLGVVLLLGDRLTSPWIEAILAGGGGIGAWLAVRGERPRRQLAMAGVALALAGIALGMSWTTYAWWGSGLGIGAILAWGDEQVHGPGPIVLLFTAAYLIAAMAGLARTWEGRGLVWVAVQGLASLAVAWWIRTGSGGATSTNRRRAARALWIAGIALPYIALALEVVRTSS